MPSRQAASAAALTCRLARQLARVRFSEPVAFAYHPLVYAAAGWRAYLRRFGDGDKPVLLVGMNPGPFGMAQTGVPFGAVSAVRLWLGIDAEVGRPPEVHPKKPVAGLACRREEVSGTRLWGWLRERFATPERCFAQTMVVNFCPVMWLDAGGRNLTPERLAAAERAPVEAACRAALLGLARLWRSRLVVGVGAFAARQARAALAGEGVAVGQMLHPSPASPLANRGWARQATATMAELMPGWGGGTGAPAAAPASAYSTLAR